MNSIALIMAGGHGERFWPRSTKEMPKQFLPLTDDNRTMLQLTVERIRPIIDIRNIYISTGKEYKNLVLQQLTELPEENILCEPFSRNTAPSIGLSAMYLSKKYDDSIMFVLPSDHLIESGKPFLDTLKEAGKIAEADNNIVTVGMTPGYPETGYGYIRYDRDSMLGRAYRVKQFVEKPDSAKAKEYFDSGEYLWNSGIFIWKVSTVLTMISQYMPDTFRGLNLIGDAWGTQEQEKILEQEYLKFASESIDYGIMEKAESVYTIPGCFRWDDVGSWQAMERIRERDHDGNVKKGKIIALNVKNSIIESSDKLIAAVGVEDLIIVGTEKATLICNKKNSNDIKKILAELNNQNFEEYL